MPNLLDELESDPDWVRYRIETTNELLAKIRNQVSRRQLSDPAQLKLMIKSELKIC